MKAWIERVTKHRLFTPLLVTLVLLCCIGPITIVGLYQWTVSESQRIEKANEAFRATRTAITLYGPATHTPGPSPTPRRARASPTPRYQLALLAARGHQSSAGGYFIVEGEVKNISSQSLEDILAVATVYDANRRFITYDEALVDYTTLLPGQTSPFSVMVDYNPAIEYYKVEFTELFGTPIAFRDDRR